MSNPDILDGPSEIRLVDVATIVDRIVVKISPEITQLVKAAIIEDLKATAGDDRVVIVQDHLKGRIIHSGKTTRMINAVLSLYDVTWDDITSQRRNPKAILARHDLMHRLSNKGGLGPSRIGQIVKRHHTTVLAGIQTHIDRMDAAGVDL